MVSLRAISLSVKPSPARKSTSFSRSDRVVEPRSGVDENGSSRLIASFETSPFVVFSLAMLNSKISIHQTLLKFDTATGFNCSPIQAECNSAGFCDERGGRQQFSNSDSDFPDPQMLS